MIVGSAFGSINGQDYKLTIEWQNHKKEIGRYAGKIDASRLIRGTVTVDGRVVADWTGSRPMKCLDK